MSYMSEDVIDSIIYCLKILKCTTNTKTNENLLFMKICNFKLNKFEKL